jgi:dTDP-4-dehydrorhamnose reductase
MYAVIGAAGQVGQEFVKVVGSDKLHLLTRAQVDVTDPDSIERSLDGVACSAIINLAAFHDVNLCEADPDNAFRVNALGAANVARVARQRGCTAVYFSSDYVFGRDATRKSPYVESDERAPVNVYGASKAAGEDQVRSTLADHLIVRSSSLFGVTTSRKGWTFPEMIVRRAQAGQPLRVVNDQYMAPTYTLDLVRSVVSLLEAGAAGTVHVTNSGGCSWHELATATLEIAGIDRPIEPVPLTAFSSAARRPSYSRLDSECVATWNVEPLRDWKLALRAYLKEKGIVP